MAAALLTTGTVFHKASPLEVSAYVQNHIGNHSLNILSPSARATLRHKNLGAVALSEISYGGQALVKSSGLDHCYHLQVVVEGACTVSYPDSEVSLLPGWATLINPGKSVDLHYSTDCQKMILKLPNTVLNACCREQFGQVPPDGVHFATSGFQLDRDSAFFRMLEMLYLEADQQARPNHIAVAQMERLLAAKLLELFPNDAEAYRRCADDEDFLLLVDRYIDDNLRRDISAEELATLCRLSLRTLYERFKRVADMSPGTYVKRRRYQAVRRQMLGSFGGAHNVTQAAMEFGFSHLGRFAAEYRELFGELPSETLATRQRAKTLKDRRRTRPS